MKIQSLKIIMTIVSMWAINTGCSSGQSTSQSFASGGDKTVSSGQMAAWFQNVKNPSNQAAYAEARMTSTSDFVQQGLSLTTNDPIQLGGHTFYNLHDTLSAHQADLDQLTGSYDTIGEFADTQGFTMASDMTPEDVQAAYDMLDKLLNQGLLASVDHTATPKASTAQLPGDNTALGLGSLWACGGSALGMAVGASLGATGCILGVIPMCAAGVVGFGASTAGMVKTCNSDYIEGGSAKSTGAATTTPGNSAASSTQALTPQTNNDAGSAAAQSEHP